MQEFNLNKIIRKYFTGTMNERESIFLENWIQTSSVNRDTFGELKKIWEERSFEPELVNTEEMIDKIWEEGVEKPGFKFRNYRDWDYIYKVVAVIMIFITVPLVEYKLLRDSFRNQPVVENGKEIRESLPGQKTRINLPDGSVAWLNGATSISYSVNFNDSARTIEMSGEGFFEVMKDPSKPFIVKCGDLETRALGTTFNVNAYPGQDLIRISLVNGRLKIEDINDQLQNIILNSGYELVYNQRTHDYFEQIFDPDEVTGWKEGRLIFRTADYQEVINKLEIWYGIEIKTTGQPPEGFRLSTVYNNESLVNILRNIRFGKDFSFELKKDELTIKFE